MRIGIDVGGTHTDAVLMNGRTVLATGKSPTTGDIMSGIVQVIKDLLASAAVDAGQIACVMIGTTHFTNALVERKGLCEVGIVRLALPSGASVPPKVGWPSDLSDQLGDHVYQMRGGYEFDGREIAALDTAAVSRVAEDIARKKLKAVAVSCAHSVVSDRMERQVFSILKAANPDVDITISSEIGRVGLLERENSAIINAACSQLAKGVVKAFGDALRGVGISAPFYISQNDGTLISDSLAAKYPVLTFASGPTNSIRGAAFLSGVQNALVMDIGGTTCDVGVLANGFPRESSVEVNVGGVRTNFRMPDVLAVGLGGGTIIGPNEVSRGKDAAAASDPQIGPHSVGYRLLQEGLVFGGNTLTATDIAVAANKTLNIGDRSKVAYLEPDFVRRVNTKMHGICGAALDQMKASSDDMPVILVGGGSVLINEDIPGFSQIQRPDHASVANAVGAAIAQVSGEVDQIYSYKNIGREEALKEARLKAQNAALAAGGVRGTENVVEVDETPLAYIAGDAVRVKVKAVADLEISS